MSVKTMPTNHVRTKKTAVQSIDSQTGTSLVEVMVALFLLGIGLLGILSLQNTSQRSNQSAMFSSLANVYAEDMVNRILANDNPVLDSDNNRYDNIDTDSITIGTVPTCSAGCNNSAVLDRDKLVWTEALSTNLPSGRGKIDYEDNIYTVTVMWDDQLTGASDDNCGGNPETDLRCTILQFQL